MDHKKEFDFIKNDKFYDLTIPNYNHVGDSVFYQINLKDLIQGSRYVCSFRFNDLKIINESLQKLKIELPQFPKTHLWKKTNKSPKLIEQRRIMLQKYFNVVINDPFTRGCKDIKIFIRCCKMGTMSRRTYSLNSKKQQNREKPRSLTKSNVSISGNLNLGLKSSKK